MLGGITGANDYTSWLSGDPEMADTYGSYDGPGTRRHLHTEQASGLELYN